MTITHSHISIVEEGFYNKLNNDACTIVPYPTVEDKHIWQVYVTNELKIKLFWLFTIRAMVWILITVKNRYLNISPVLKFDSRWTKRSENELMQPTPAGAIHDQFFLTLPTIRQVLTMLLLTTLFTWAFQSWLSLFKCLQEFKAAYQYGQLERLIFEYA